MELITRQLQALPVVIIGAGPAGCAAAIALGQVGIDCIVLEGRADVEVWPFEEPRESLHAGVEVLLRSIRCERVFTLAATGSYTGIVRQGVFEPLAPHGQSDWHGVHVRRSVFDGYLRQRAMAGGATLRYRTKVRDLVIEGDRVVGVRLGTGELLSASYVIDATGRQQLGGRRIRSRREYASEPLVARTGRVTRAKFPNNSARFSSGNDGWTWWAVDNDGSGTWTHVSSQAPKAAPDVQGIEHADTAQRVFGVRWTLNRPLVCNGLLIAGDAASMLDPAAGQGVFKALKDGLRAASAIVEIRQGSGIENWHLAMYDQDLVTTFEECTEKLASAYEQLNVPFRVGLA